MLKLNKLNRLGAYTSASLVTGLMAAKMLKLLAQLALTLSEPTSQLVLLNYQVC